MAPGGKKGKLLKPEMPILLRLRKSMDLPMRWSRMPCFKQVGSGTSAQILDGCDIAGYKLNRFDIPIPTRRVYAGRVELDLEATPAGGHADLPT